MGSSQYISAVTEVQKGQVGVEGVARHVSGTLEKVSTHYPAPFRQRVVEVILVILVAALILLICDSMSLNWLLCYEKAKKHIVI